jgi:enediyne biosynthesis protein E4
LGQPEEGKTLALRIVWPSGKTDSMTGIKPNQFVTVQEGKGIISTQPIVFAPTASPSAR